MALSLTTDDFQELSTIRYGRPVYWVGPAGSNGTARSPTTAKTTLAAAKAVAPAGSLIIVLPGTYDEGDILKDLVDWHFNRGANIVYTGVLGINLFGATTAIRSRVTGHGQFKCQGADTNGNIFECTHAGARIYVEADEFGSNPNVGLDTHDVAVKITNGVVELKVPRIDSSGAASSRTFDISGGTVTFSAPSMTIGDGIDLNGAVDMTVYSRIDSHNTGYSLRGSGFTLRAYGDVKAEAQAITVSAGVTGTAFFDGIALHSTAGSEPAISADGTTAVALYLRRCFVIAPASATSSIYAAGGTMTVTVDHHTTLNKVVGAGITLNYATTAGAIAGTVWDEDLADHAGVGTSGLVLTDAAASASTASGNAANAASNAQTAADNAASLLLRVPAASHTGTATAAAATTITLAVGASAVDDFYKGHVISIDAGSTGANQHRIITGYVGATRVATVKAWDTTPTGAAYTIVGNTRPPNEESLLINASGHVTRVTTVDTTTSGGGGSLTITPILATTTNPRYSTRDLPPIAEGSEPTEVFTIVDAQGTAVNLSGKTVRLVAVTVDEDEDTEAVFDDTLAGSFKYETGGGGITIGGAGNNVATVVHDDAKTGTPGEYRYFLWNVTDKLLLTKGSLKIEPALIDV